MDAPRVAVLDVGKSSLRVTLVDSDGGLVATRRTSSFPSGRSPYLHLDVPRTLDWLVAALGELARDHAIEALVPVGHGAAAGLVRAGELVLPVMDYDHEIPPLELPPGAFGETFSPTLPRGLNLAAQLAWIEKHHAREFERAEHLLTLPQLLAHLLGGRPACEVTSLGCHTHLWSPAEGAPSRLARERGWARLLPPRANAWDQVGVLDPRIAERAGLERGCRVHAGIHDSNASYLVHRAARDAPFAVVSTGTWVVCMAHGASLAKLRPERDMLANVDAFGDPVACMRFPGGREVAALAGEDGLACAPEPRDVQAVLDAGTLALPAFSGVGGPFAGRPGRVLPAPPAEPRARAALAALYAALVVDLCLDELGASGDVILEGPLAANAAFAGVLADLRAPAPVLASSDATGTARGAALLARWGDRRAPSDPALARGLARVEPARLRGLLDPSGHRARWRAGLPTEPHRA